MGNEIKVLTLVDHACGTSVGIFRKDRALDLESWTGADLEIFPASLVC